MQTAHVSVHTGGKEMQTILPRIKHGAELHNCSPVLAELSCLSPSQLCDQTAWLFGFGTSLTPAISPGFCLRREKVHMSESLMSSKKLSL